MDAGVTPLLTLAAALAVVDAIEPLLPRRAVSIKWPNDVRIDGKKVAGVLAEASVRGQTVSFAILGIGVNVGGTTLPDAIATLATTLRIARGAPVDRAQVLGALLVALETRLDALASDGTTRTAADVAARCDTLGQQVQVDELRGTAEAIEASGALRIRRDDGTCALVHAGEVAAARS
jgi:BirA family biotin operon repressor/biotin-[acetyl-CoA-carboxylase] ligase